MLIYSKLNSKEYSLWHVGMRRRPWNILMTTAAGLLFSAAAVRGWNTYYDYIANSCTTIFTRAAILPLDWTRKLADSDVTGSIRILLLAVVGGGIGLACYYKLFSEKAPLESRVRDLGLDGLDELALQGLLMLFAFVMPGAIVIRHWNYGLWNIGTYLTIWYIELAATLLFIYGIFKALRIKPLYALYATGGILGLTLMVYAATRRQISEPFFDLLSQRLTSLSFIKNTGSESLLAWNARLPAYLPTFGLEWAWLAYLILVPVVLVLICFLFIKLRSKSILRYYSRVYPNEEPDVDNSGVKAVVTRTLLAPLLCPLLPWGAWMMGGTTADESMGGIDAIFA